MVIILNKILPNLKNNSRKCYIGVTPFDQSILQGVRICAYVKLYNLKLSRPKSVFFNFITWHRKGVHTLEVRFNQNSELSHTTLHKFMWKMHV